MSALDAATTGLPRAFGRYVLFDLIGKGGMAEIYLARARTEESGGARLVVVKQILPELSANAKFADALVAEAKLAARLSHANVVQVLDLGRAPEADGSRLYIAMEYVEGLDLNELLRRCARAKIPLPFEFALLMVMETLKGLDYAHRRTDDEGRPLGIVHRDVSPSNVIVSVDGEVKLCDFGIARANDFEATVKNAPGDAISADAIQGKAGYMSPEHARGEPLDARADVFAAGVILWELCAGKRLYRVDKTKNESLLEVARRANVPPLQARGLAHEDELHRIVHKALAVDASERYESAAAMLQELQRYVAKARLIASPIRLGEWLTDRFGAELVEVRRARERAVRALEAGPAASVTPLDAAVAPRGPSAVVKMSKATSIIPEPEVRVEIDEPSISASPPHAATHTSGANDIPRPASIPRDLPAPPPPFRLQLADLDAEERTKSSRSKLIAAIVVAVLVLAALAAFALKK